MSHSAGLLTTSDVANLLRISPRQVVRLAARRELGHVRIGRVYRFTAEQVQRYRDASTIRPSGWAA